MPVPEKTPQQPADHVETASAAPDQQERVKTPDTINELEEEKNVLRQNVEETDHAKGEKTAEDKLDKELNKQAPSQKQEAEKAAAQPEAAPKTIWNQASDGLGKTMEHLGNVAGTIGGYMNEIWQKIKPHIAKIAAIPGFSYIFGEENAKKLQEWLGHDPTMIEILEASVSRIRKDVIFPDTDKDALGIFNDLYSEMLLARGDTVESYDKNAFVGDLIPKLAFHDIPSNKEDKKELTMDRIKKAARILINETAEEEKNEDDSKKTTEEGSEDTKKKNKKKKRKDEEKKKDNDSDAS